MNIVQFFADYAIRGIFAGNISITWHIMNITIKTSKYRLYSVITAITTALKFRERIGKHYRIAVIWRCARSIHKNSIDIYHGCTMTVTGT